MRLYEDPTPEPTEPTGDEGTGDTGGEPKSE